MTVRHTTSSQTSSLGSGSVLLGKEHQIKLALACLFARGHLLIEDLPGMGKTMLSHALARVLGLSFNRIQFTSDVLPGDIVGVSVFDREQNAFRFVAGPGVCAGRAGRRGQPRNAEDTERVARGDGRTAGHGRRSDATVARTRSS